ncbi:MAG: zinc-ribbon domain-containing protein, partial [Maricaulaceae bacterium]
MILTCPSCSTRYFAEGANLGPKGRIVRCAACGHTWRAKEADAAPPPPEIDDEDPELEAALETALGEDVTEVGAGEPAADDAPPSAPKTPERPLAPGAPNMRASLIRWGSAGAAVLAGVVLLVIFRVEVVGFWPRAAGVYAAAGFEVTAEGLVFEQIAAEPGYADGEPTLTITAVVRNTTGRPRPVPPVRISLFDQDA